MSIIYKALKLCVYTAIPYAIPIHAAMTEITTNLRFRWQFLVLEEFPTYKKVGQGHVTELLSSAARRSIVELVIVF
jgi:hypothetical protein